MAENKKYSFFAYIDRMKYINRWGLMKNTSCENIQEHSLQTAVLAHALALIRNKYFSGNLNAEKACVYAIYHDSSEIITGDLPTPIKYFNRQINESYKEIEALSKEKLLNTLPEDLIAEYREVLFFEDNTEDYYIIVKAADKLSAYIKCLEEVKSGNKEFESAKDAIFKSLEEMHLPELSYFIETFLPPYELSLDELG